MAEREIELKLELTGGEEMLAGHPLLAGIDPAEAAQASTYFDTKAGLVRRAGFSLRVRQVGDRFVQTVKMDAGAAGLFDRPEWEAPIGGSAPDRAALAATPLGAILDGKAKALRPVATIIARRRRWDLYIGDDRVEIIHDAGEATSGVARQAFSEVELELKSGAPDALFRIGRGLAETLEARIGVLTKAERGQRLAEGRTGRAAKAEPVVLRPKLSVAEGFAVVAHACLRHYRLNEPLVTQHDPAALHQARVALRRLRSALTLFRPALIDGAYAELREALRWLTGLFGDARNLDVLIARIGDEAPDARAQLEAQRVAAYERLVAALTTPRARLLPLDLLAWVETGAWRRRKKAGRPLADFASDRLDRRWRKVKHGAASLPGADDEARHDFRIEIKKLRYAVEFLAGLFADEGRAKKLKAFRSALERLQEELGALNDAATGATMLAEAGLEPGGEAAPAAELIARVERRARRLAKQEPFWR